MNKEWWLVEAGEYVLGTLRGSERELFEKLLKSDPDAQTLVMYWERQFNQLDTVLTDNHDGSAVLPPSLWETIEARIRDEHASLTETPDLKAPNAALNVRRETLSEKTAIEPIVQSLKRKLRWWETIGALSLAACFALVAVLVTQWSSLTNDLNVDPSANTPDAYTIVSVLSASDGRQLWAIVADESNGQVRAIALEPPVEQPDQSHQLWVVLPDNQGVESIGLLPYENGSIQTFTLNKESSLPKLKSGEAFAISVEPPGGTTSAAPTGPVISSQAYTRVSETF